MTQQLPKSSKKPYGTPQLSIYGDVREITQTVGMSGNSDGGSGGMNKSMA